MALKLSPTTPSLDRDTGALETAEYLGVIEDLVSAGKDRLALVSGVLVSQATKDATISMYEDLLKQAKNKKSLAETHAQYMTENIDRLQEMIAQAAYQYEQFDAALSTGTGTWISEAEAHALRLWFTDPSLLEMYRSMWWKTEWQEMKREGMQLAAEAETLATAFKRSGLSVSQVPQMSTIQNPQLFLAADRTPAMRLSLVRQADAAITAVQTGRMALLKKSDAFLHTLTDGETRCMHQKEIGTLLQRMMQSANPEQFYQQTIVPLALQCKQTRARYDGYVREYVRYGQPDTCAPMPLDAFLQLPPGAPEILTQEWYSRLEAATRGHESEQKELDTLISLIRRSVNLKDLDTAEARLNEALRTHGEHPELQSIRAHVDVLRLMQQQEPPREEEMKTADAHRNLHAIRRSVPSAFEHYYAYFIEECDAVEAEEIIDAMNTRVTRKQQGTTTHHDEFHTTQLAETIDQTTAYNTRSEILVGQDTPPSHVVSLVREAKKRSQQAPALVFAGLSFEQYVQLIPMNQQLIADKHRLERANAAA